MFNTAPAAAGNKIMNTDFYIKVANRRRNWEVIKPSDRQITVEGSDDTLSKALALSKLELPVGEWIAEELAKNSNLTAPIKQLMLANIDDELKHDEALNNLRAVYPVKPEDDAEVDRIVAEADRLAGIYSPVVMAGVLESSLFFVILPIYRFLGGAAFRTISADISNDEQLHVATNLQLSKDLGYRRGSSINNFRKQVVDWLVSDLSSQNENKYLNSDFWQRSSESLYFNGKAPELRDTKRSIMPAFFETSGSSLPLYS